ncbi:MAG: ParB N-terminal domain-containing protein [bacterium]|nr:ParB N-terminal domain-containing protein [bacterium]
MKKQMNLEDKTFCFTYNLYSPDLEASIRRSGVLAPVILKDSRIISGFRRAYIANKLNIDDIPTIITTDSDLDAFLDVIIENIAVRVLNDLEKAMIIHKLLNDFKSGDAILKLVCKILKIGFSEYNIQKYLQISALDDDLKELIYKKKIRWETAVALSNLPDRHKILILLNNLKFNANFSAEIVENLKDIFRQNKGLPSEIFSFENANNLRDFLKNKKFPILMKQERNFSKVMQLLPNNMTLKHFPYFEKDECDLNIKFKNLEEVKQWIQSQK